MSSSWAPAGESASELWFERSVLAGLFLGAVAFGVHATLFIWCFKLLYPRRKGRREQIFLTYIVVVFILSNIGNATNIKFGEETFINNRDYPGGPAVYFVQQSTNIAALLCNSVYIVLSWFQDALLLYRFWIIFSRRYSLVVFPTLMFFASVVMSCFLIAMLSEPTVTLWTAISFQIAISYWSISIAFNIIVTVLITSRLLYMRHVFEKTLRTTDCTVYTSVSAMLVESAFIYSSTGLVFLISFAVDSPVQNLALPLLGQVQSIAPLLIILRVAQGKAWSKDTVTALTNTTDIPLAFRPARTTTTGAGSTTVAPVPSDKSYALESTVNITGGDLEVGESMAYKSGSVEYQVY